MDQFVIGTAGHIDHGKTNLVKALTGTDTDRLVEEQDRGMTIDLGFAFLNENVTIIDVPGHEKFIRNMVAGVSTIHLALLVVAADDGIMPQTREHLQILKLLNIPQCVVALTKIDLAPDADWIDLLELEILDLIKDIFPDVEIIHTSTTTGAGINQLNDLLLQRAVDVQLTKDNGSFRLQIDRVFSMTGFGTVVTGTVIRGGLKKGETVEVLPGMMRGKVRGIQSHGFEVESVHTGDRAAVNLSGVDGDKITRGSELTALGTLTELQRFTAHIQHSSVMKKKLQHRQRVRIHLGTAEVLARIHLVEKKTLETGSEANVIIDLERALVAAAGDRFVIRSYSPMATIGGGAVLTTFIPEGVNVKNWVSKLDVDPQKRFSQLVSSCEPRNINNWRRFNQVSSETIKRWIKDLGLNTTQNQIVFIDEMMDHSIKRVVDILVKYHEKNPLRKAMGSDLLKQGTGMNPDWLHDVLAVLKKKGTIRADGSGYALATHSVELAGGAAELLEKIENCLSKNGFTPLTNAEISSIVARSEKDCLEILHVLKNEEKVLEVRNSVWIHSASMAKLRSAMKGHFNTHDELKVADFKSITGLTRKFAIPVLEYCDKRGWSIREGNVRLAGEEL